MDNFNFIKKEPITKGWSGDKKHCVSKAGGIKYLLRISPIEQYERKKSEFEMMRRVAALDIPMCQPTQFGTCEDGVYSLQSWIDGKDAEDVIPLLSDTEQYVYGLEAGRILKKIHSIPAPANQEDWKSRFNRKIDHKIKGYADCPIKFDGSDRMIDYINANRHLINNRPQCFLHNDYHLGNILIYGNKPYVVDFGDFDFGDPWTEFVHPYWSARKNRCYVSGLINGYFNDNPSEIFFKTILLYVALHALESFINLDKDALQEATDMLNWQRDMQNPIPTWYFKGYYLQYSDGLPYKLKAPFDFGFLSHYGTAFKIFDDQDSGNICFGIEKDRKRYFIKFAGAPTEQYDGKTEDAVARLKATLPVYQALKHPNLIEFVCAEEIGGGYAMVFQWVDGECMGRMYPASRQKFMQMDTKTKLKIFRNILAFFEYVALQGYVAIDFYDGSILYDLERQKTIVCDIDFFRKMPCTNDMGRMWGSSRFQSPEEYQLGAVLDEITNVYTIGATAFALLSDYDRSREAWSLSDKTFEVVAKAVSDDRQNRQQSIKQFIDEWEAALCQLV